MLRLRCAVQEERERHRDAGKARRQGQPANCGRAHRPAPALRELRWIDQALAPRALQELSLARGIALGHRHIGGVYVALDELAEPQALTDCPTVRALRGPAGERIDPILILIRHAISVTPKANWYHSARCSRARLRHCEMNSRVAPGVRPSSSPISSWVRPSSTIQAITSAWDGDAVSKRRQQRLKQSSSWARAASESGRGIISADSSAILSCVSLLWSSG